MELLTNNNNHWLIQPYRSVGAITINEGKALVKSRSLTAVFKQPAGNGKYFISAASNTDCSDFGSAVSSWGLANEIKTKFIYLEQIKGRVLICVCENGRVLFDSFIELSDLSDCLSSFEGSDVYVADAKVIPGNVHTAEVGSLTAKLNAADFAFEFSADGLAEPVPVWFYAALVLVVVAISVVAYFALKPSEEAAYVSPYRAFNRFHVNDSINALNRLNQMFNAQTRLLALQGWELVSITPTRLSVAYELSPVSDGMEKRAGDMETLHRYASINDLSVLVEPNKLNGAVTLMETAANIQATHDHRLYEVENVNNFIRDAVELYIPGATTDFIRDVAFDGRAWRLREIEVSFARHDTRYLNTLGAIVEGLPVTFGGDKGDLQIGTLVVDKGLVSGKLKLSIIGE
jgi:hypothetical protein